MAVKDLLLLMRFEGRQLTLDAAYLFKKATGRSEEFGRLVLCRCFVLVRMLECLLKQKLFSNLRIFNFKKFTLVPPYFTSILSKCFDKVRCM